MKQYRLIRVSADNALEVEKFCRDHGILYSTHFPIAEEDITVMKLLFPDIGVQDYDIPYCRLDGDRYE